MESFLFQIGDGVLSKEIVGACFPVPHHLMKRFFKDGKKVFVKNSKFSKLKPGSKIIFYASRDIHALIGEGTIETVEFLTPKETIQKYKNNLFLTEKELNTYAREKNVSKFLVARFSKIKEYPNPVKPKRFISIGGKYVSKPEYNEILSKASI